MTRVLRHRSGAPAAGLLAVLLASSASADPAAVDEARSAWRWRRAVTVASEKESASPFAALVVEPEVAAAAGPELRGVRLVGADGREVPYVVDRRVDRSSTRRWDGALVDTRKDPRRSTEWVVDLLERRAFDTVELSIPGRDFAKRVRIEVSDDRERWKKVQVDAGVFDRAWTSRVHHTAIPLAEAQTARYVRLTADDTRTRPVDVEGVAVSARRPFPGESWARPVALEPLGARNGVSRYRLKAPPGLPVERFDLAADDPAFFREAVLVEERSAGERKDRVVLADALLYRLKLDDAELAGEDTSFPVRLPESGALVLEVRDGDSPPLRNPRGAASGAAVRLVFPWSSGAAETSSLTLYYGNPATRAPVYDIEGLRSRLSFSRRHARAEAGPEAENPRWRPAPPLQFAASVAAPLEARAWKWERPLGIPGGEDLYTVTLPAADLSETRRGCGDLRIVDAADRQIPYILEADAAEERIALRVAPEKSSDSAGRASRYRLSASDRTTGKALALPWVGVRLEFAENFFDRKARLRAEEAPGAARRGERVCFDGPIARRIGAAAGSPEADERRPVEIGLDGEPSAALLLEIMDGDNAPLTMTEAWGIVRVPRATFKLKPEPGGRYRLLLGNDQAEPPRYDLQSLSQEVLAYSAAPVKLGGIAPNPAFRRALGDYFRSAPPAAILWGALLAGVLALLLLSVRILKQPASK